MTIETELKNEKIRELSNEVNDGAMDSWIGENINDLQAEFIDEYNDEWINFCKTKWNELNE